jgi:hypothetical protein
MSHRLLVILTIASIVAATGSAACWALGARGAFSFEVTIGGRPWRVTLGDAAVRIDDQPQVAGRVHALAAEIARLETLQRAAQRLMISTDAEIDAAAIRRAESTGELTRRVAEQQGRVESLMSQFRAGPTARQWRLQLAAVLLPSMLFPLAWAVRAAAARRARRRGFEVTLTSSDARSG